MCWLGLPEFGIGCSGLGACRAVASRRRVGLFFSSFIGTRVMPHFGHWPGSARTTSGCIGQVYLCARSAGGEALGVGVGSAKAAVAAHVMAAAIKIKICFFISMLKLILSFRRGRRKQHARARALPRRMGLLAIRLTKAERAHARSRSIQRTTLCQAVRCRARTR